MKLRELGERLAGAGLHEPAEHFGRLHDHLVAEPDEDGMKDVLHAILGSAGLATKHEFDLDARRAFADAWACAREILEGGEPPDRTPGA